MYQHQKGTKIEPRTCSATFTMETKGKRRKGNKNMKNTRAAKCFTLRETCTVLKHRKIQNIQCGGIGFFSLPGVVFHPS